MTARKSQCCIRTDTCSSSIFEATVGGATQDSPEKQNQEPCARAGERSGSPGVKLVASLPWGENPGATVCALTLARHSRSAISHFLPQKQISFPTSVKNKANV